MSKTKTMEKVTENKNVHAENAAPQAEAPAQKPVFEEIEHSLKTQ